MTEAEWKAKCAARFVERSGMSQDEAETSAQACWEEREEGEQPEDAADTDMSYWTDDEAVQA